MIAIAIYSRDRLSIKWEMVSLGLCVLFVIAALCVVPSDDGLYVTVFGKAVKTQCIMMQKVGMPCPSCGCTRSCALLMRGEVGEAVQRNPSGLVVIAFVLAVGVYRGLRLANILQVRLPFSIELVGAVVVLVVMYVVWVVRCDFAVSALDGTCF